MHSKATFAYVSLWVRPQNTLGGGAALHAHPWYMFSPPTIICRLRPLQWPYVPDFGFLCCAQVHSGTILCKMPSALRISLAIGDELRAYAISRPIRFHPTALRCLTVAPLVPLVRGSVQAQLR